MLRLRKIVLRHDPDWASITGWHSPAISTSEIHNLSYKDN